jgi:multiple sugar transport system substrate-binding protein
MPEILMSAMIGSVEALDLGRFRAAVQQDVRLQKLSWENAWNELLSYGLHNRGPDISQVGTTWLGSLVSMQALTPFAQHEIDYLGGSQLFNPVSWETSTPPGELQVFAIPWIADTRQIVYRRDMLAKAGVDEATAFASHENLIETLSRLQAWGHPCPWAMPTAEEVIHNIAPWVWAQGGHFRSVDRHQLTLTDAKTLAGMQQFYELHRFIAPVAQNLTTAAVNELFLTGEPAVILTIQDILPQMVYHEAPSFGLDNVGAAPVPGIPFIGGSGLVIWQHAFRRDIALQLIRFLCSQPSQSRLLEHTHQIPVRGDVLESEQFTQHRLFKALSDSLMKGRAFQSSYQWGTIEARLFPVFNLLWQDLFANPELDLKTELAQRMTEISNRLEKNLLSSQSSVERRLTVG